jgi:hypothetical protein
VSDPAPSATGTDDGSSEPEPADAAPRSARWLVAVVLVALAIPGVIGFDLWPLTGWRLFSRASGSCQERWFADAVDPDGTIRSIGAEELPYRFRHVEWQLAQLAGTSELPLDGTCPSAAPRNEHSSRGASQDRRDRLCSALLGAVAETHPTTVELRIVRDQRHMVEQDGDWVTTHDPEVFHTCRI